MDFNALQHKLFALDPSDPTADKKALVAQAQGAVPDAVPTKDYIAESVDVPQGSMPLGLDSIADFAALAGVRIDEKQKMGSAGQAKGKDTMPKAKPGRTKHPLKDKLVGEAPQGFKAGFKGYNKVDPWLGGSSSDEKKSDKPTEKPKPGEKPQPEPKPQGGGAPPPSTGGWPTSQEGYTLKPGDLVDYANAKGAARSKIPVVDLIPGKKDSNGDPQIQLELRGATYAISRDQITAVNGKPFTLTSAAAGTGTIKDELLNALEAYKSKPIKPRDPNSQAMNDLRKSGAMGAHKDKKKVLPRKEKHKGKMDESSKNLDAMDAEKLRKEYAKDWEVRKGKYLYKKVAFDDYNTVIRFLMVIEKPQIELDHFADIKFFYNEAELIVYTHDTKGLTTLDFKLAVQIDRALDRMGVKEIG
jgi:pterin-4a-carbinolamine dehydratase